MNADRDEVWRRCVRLGRVLLPLVDREPWRRERRHETLRAWGVDTGTGEGLIGICAALAAHTVAKDASASPEEFGALTVTAVAGAAGGSQDFELLAGAPDRFDDERDERAVMLLRVCSYAGDRHALLAFRLAQETRRALTVLAARSPQRPLTCQDVLRMAVGTDPAG
ncbi:hypothetical protein [Streptomyces sp. SID8352]|uniref:hypothetical protein n=1 Tax=Streptomyces sp. SID8352 TaxID=2690338 RepID=UPI00136B7AF4|nr:hypothetical protein [Streptomyces sp. SID8352]MYU24730.1 hypothetical protein [Streptomyces sp. SID8352]